MMVMVHQPGRPCSDGKIWHVGTGDACSDAFDPMISLQSANFKKVLQGTANAVTDSFNPIQL